MQHKEHHSILQKNDKMIDFLKNRWIIPNFKFLNIQIYLNIRHWKLIKYKGLITKTSLEKAKPIANEKQRGKISDYIPYNMCVKIREKE